MIQAFLGYHTQNNYPLFYLIFKQVSATYKDGYRALAVSCLSGPRSVEKIRKTGEAILKR